MTDIHHTIAGRRAIRKYTDRPVEEEKLQRVLQAARLAPTWANLQCWKVIVVRDAGTKQALSDLSNVASAGYAGNPCRKALAAAPVVLVTCADPERSGKLNGKAYYLVDSGIVMDHIMLSATALGLGTCFVVVFDEEGVRKVLGIPSHIEVVGMTPLGYPERIPDPRPRNDLSEMVAYDRWS
ncbi:MAG: nitroreductase family protein [Chloroflexi bacterium]|nr:nitroreductase family protein [Chloroflexota bacterium]